MTEEGTPVVTRTKDEFPAESRDVFPDVDRVVGPDGILERFKYGEDNVARDALRGKNTWILWGEGNEVFWNWVQQHGYGLTDFLVLLDSRSRDTRFARAGLINQPGMKSQTEKGRRILGLYLDQAVSDDAVLLPGANYRYKTTPLFRVGDEEMYKDVLSKLADDGVNPAIYGYPSGIVGLRLFLNPDFFGDTPAAESARNYWMAKVVEPDDDAYYAIDKWVSKDPKLVRPFRVSMSCGFCHVSPHPLSPPIDPEHPEWKDLSSTIGDQYWNPVMTFTNLQDNNSFLYQFLASQQPGTIDTSLVSTDHINNANTITAIFDVPSRLKRAATNATEKQSTSNLLIPSVEDPSKATDPRHTPRVLIDGSDSVGVFGALSRVYLNIGAYSEEWKRVHNTVVGFRPQRPFAVETALKKSVYWNATDDYRIPYLAKFFTYPGADNGGSVTRPMRLADAPDADKKSIEDQKADALKGREVFIQNCAICHSSKQPEGFALKFSKDWAKEPALKKDAPAVLTLPTDFADWPAFIGKASYEEYVRQLREHVVEAPTDQGDPFIKDNFLSNEIRIPVTLVGTNSGRAVATNAMRGQVWDNFSSEAYKELAAVGDVRFFNPFLTEEEKKEEQHKLDQWGNNDSYTPPGEGPGYYRPASLISLWATAPYLHNNTLGLYNHNPSVAGRLEAFEDGIDKLLWKKNRNSIKISRIGDLRQAKAADGKMEINAAGEDEGFIYRTTNPSYIEFTPQFIKPLISGVLGSTWTSVLTSWVWWGVAAIFLGFALFGHNRHAGFLFALVGVLTAVILRWSSIDTVYPILWWLPVLLAGAALLLWFGDKWPWLGRLAFLVATAAFLLWSGIGAIYPAFWWWPVLLAIAGLLLVFLLPSPWIGGLVLVVATVVLVLWAWLGDNYAAFWGLPLLLAIGALSLWIFTPWHRVGQVVFFLVAIQIVIAQQQVDTFVAGGSGVLRVGPIPKGTPVNLLMNINPEASVTDLMQAAFGLTRGVLRIRKDNLQGDAAWEAFEREAAKPLMRASKCPDFVLDRGHWFAETLRDDEKAQLKAFLRTL